MTETRRTRPNREPTTQTMRDVSHTHPYTDRGAVNRPFERGPVVAADGGERIDDSRTPKGGRSESFGSEREAYDGDEEDAERADEESTPKMKDVDHTPPRDADSANRVFERGGKEEPVESEE